MTLVEKQMATAERLGVSWDGLWATDTGEEWDWDYAPEFHTAIHGDQYYVFRDRSRSDGGVTTRSSDYDVDEDTWDEMDQDARADHFEWLQGVHAAEVRLCQQEEDVQDLAMEIFEGYVPDDSGREGDLTRATDEALRRLAAE